VTMSMRRNHIDCRSRKNDYKTSGHKRPDLRTGVFFCIFMFFGDAELKDKPGQPETLPSN